MVLVLRPVLSPLILFILAIGVAASGCEREYEPDPRNQQGCLDRRTAVSADEALPLGFSAAQILAFTGGAHEAELRWPTGPGTRLRHSLESPALFFVRSAHDPDFPLSIGVQCRDHLLLEGPTTLSTTDGQLDERWAEARLRSFDDQRAQGVVTVETKNIRGAYQANLVGDQCLLGLQFNLSFTPTGFSGGILKTVAAAACGALKDLTGVSPQDGGTWGPPPASN